MRPGRDFFQNITIEQGGLLETVEYTLSWIESLLCSNDYSHSPRFPSNCRYRPSSSFGTAAATSEDAASLENDETGDKLRREAQAAIDRATVGHV